MDCLEEDPIFCRLELKSDDAAATTSLLQKLENEVHLYFERKLTEPTFSYPIQGTTFQMAVWHAVMTIPYGETRSYSALAQAIGHPRAARAVALALHANPLPLLIPCHRVIQKNMALGGYNGGRERKAYLIDFESKKRSPE